MKKVITYGTYDLLQRAKALGDDLIVGVTNDNFDRDRERRKLNVVKNVRVGIASCGLIAKRFRESCRDVQVLH